MEREELKHLYDNVLQRSGIDLNKFCPNCTKRLLDELCDIYYCKGNHEL